MDNTGWVKIFRTMLDWEWYDDIPTKVLWIHLLLKANHEERRWHGITLKPGQRFTSISHLAEETGLTRSQVRTALEHLASTGEITKTSHGNGTLVTIEKWDFFQGQESSGRKPIANQSQSGRKPIATNKNDKNDKNEKNIYRELSPELTEALKDFETMRIRIKAPLTDRAMRNLISKLSRMADLSSSAAVAIVNQSTENCWKSFYPLKEEEQSKLVATDQRDKRRRMAQLQIRFNEEGISAEEERELKELEKEFYGS